jgi:hypothetical protein
VVVSPGNRQRTKSGGDEQVGVQVDINNLLALLPQKVIKKGKKEPIAPQIVEELKCKYISAQSRWQATDNRLKRSIAAHSAKVLEAEQLSLMATQEGELKEQEYNLWTGLFNGEFGSELEAQLASLFGVDLG